MTNIESASLGQFLSYYPAGWSYDEVITGIEDEVEGVAIWQPFENYDVGYVIQEIENLKMVMSNLD
jgi:hypothetical protein|tara:strand:+ start:58 stop:255 length:198 start_codon:yes stop_codon:yes gene_type:complete